MKVLLRVDSSSGSSMEIGSMPLGVWLWLRSILGDSATIC